MRAGLPLVALLCTFPPVVAQVLPPIPADVPAPVAEKVVAPDFSEGLKRLAELGLPPMQGAEWVRKPDSRMTLFADRGLRQLGVKLKGGVWKLPGETPQYLDFGSATRVEAEAKKEEAAAGGNSGGEPNMLQRMLNHYESEKPQKPKVAPEQPDLALEVELLVDALAKVNKASQNRGDFLSEDDFGGSRPENPYAHCLIFAAQLQAAGKTQEASKLAAALFVAFPARESLIDGAIAQFADEAYEALVKDFFAHPDWAKYRDGVKALLVKYPRGWNSAGAVAILAGALEKRASGAQPPVPSLPGIELKPEAIAKVAALLDPPPANAGQISDEELAKARHLDLSRYPAAQRAQIVAMLRDSYESGDEQTPGSLWTLTPKAEDAQSADPVAALRAMGMDGVAALAAVAKDDTLTLREDLPGRGRSRSYYYGGNRSDEEIALSNYNSLERPRTRGEIATTLLSEILPEGRERSYSGDEKDVGSEALDFWKEHHSKTPVELALVYARDGSEEQAMMAGTFLAEQSDPQARQALEKLILTSESPAEYGPLVLTYLTKTGANGRAFYDQYAKLIHRNYDGMDLADVGYGTPEYQIRSAGSVDNFLGTMGIKVGATSLKELIENVVKADDKDENNQSWRQAAIAINSLSAQQRLAEIGPVAVSAPAEKLSLLFQLLLRRSGGDFEGQGSGEESEEDDEKLPPEVQETWKKVLARAEPLPENDAPTQWMRDWGAKTFGDAAAIVLEAALTPGSQQSAREFMILEGSGTGVCAIMRRQVEARFDQKPLPEWPSADKVSAERKAELKTQIGKLAAKDVLPFAKALPLDERAAVFAWVSGAEEQKEEEEDAPKEGENAPKLPASVTDAMELIVSSLSSDPSKPSDPELMKTLGIEMGQKLNLAEVKALSERMTKDYKTLSKASVTFEPAQMGLGYNVVVRHLDDREAYQYASYSNRSLDEKVEGFTCIAARNILSQTVEGGAVKPLRMGAPQSEEAAASSQAAGLGADEYLKSVLQPEAGLVMTRSLMLWTFTREDSVKAAASGF